MDIARDICTDSFYIVNSGLPCIAVTAVRQYYQYFETLVAKVDTQGIYQVGPPGKLLPF